MRLVGYKNNIKNCTIFHALITILMALVSSNTIANEVTSIFYDSKYNNGVKANPEYQGFNDSYIFNERLIDKGYGNNLLGHEFLKARGKLTFYRTIIKPQLYSLKNAYLQVSQKVEAATIYENNILQASGKINELKGLYDFWKKDNYKGIAKAAASEIVSRETTKQVNKLSGFLDISSEAKDLVANQVNSIVNGVVFDVLLEKDKKKKMAALATLLEDKTRFAAVNLASWLKAVPAVYKEYSVSLEIKFLEQYYVCAESLDCILSKANIPKPFVWDYLSKKLQLQHAIVLYTNKRSKLDAIRNPGLKSRLLAGDELQDIYSKIEYINSFIDSAFNVYLDRLNKIQSDVSSNNMTLSIAMRGNGIVQSSNSSEIDCSVDEGDHHNLCSAYLQAGAQITLTSTPSEGYVFKEWKGACTGSSATCTVVLNNSELVTAVFEEIPSPDLQFDLLVSKAGQGTIISHPGGISCGQDCSETYLRGQSVTLIPTPESNYFKFYGWSSSECQGDANCTITLDSNKIVTGHFSACVGADYLWKKADPLYVGGSNNFDAQFAITNRCNTSQELANMVIALHHADTGLFYKHCYESGPINVQPSASYASGKHYCTIDQPGVYRLVGKINIGTNGQDYWIDLINHELTVLIDDTSPQVPASPMLLNLSAESSSEIELTWNAAVNGLYHRLYRSTSANSGFNEIYSDYSLSFLDNGLAADTTYYYKLKSCHNLDLSSCSEFSSVSSATTQSAPDISTLLSAFTVSTSSLRLGDSVLLSATIHNPGGISYLDYFEFGFLLSSNDVLDATDIVIYNNQASGFSINQGSSLDLSYNYVMPNDQALGSQKILACVLYKPSQLLAKESYCQSVELTVYQDALDIPDAPFKPYLEQIPNEPDVSIAWNASTGGKYYRLFRSDTENGSYHEIFSGNAFSYLDSRLTIDQSYYYKLKSCQNNDPGTCSSLSGFNSIQVIGATSHDFSAERVELSKVGQLLSIEANQRYSGNSPTILNVQLGFYLSSDTDCSVTEDVLLGSSQSGLSANDLVDREEITVTLPDYTNTGTWYVCAIADYDNKYSETDESNNFSLITVSTDVPAPTPSALIANEGQIRLTWSPVPGTVSYRLTQSTTDQIPLDSYVYTGTNTEHLDQGLELCKAYYYQLQSCNSVSASALCSLSPVVKSYTLPYISPAPSVKALNHYKVDINWEGSECASYYYIARTHNGNRKLIYVGSDHNFVDDTDLQPNTVYQYVIGYCGREDGYFNNGCAYGSDPVEVTTMQSEPVNTDWVEHQPQSGLLGRKYTSPVLFKNKLWLIGGDQNGQYKNDIWSSYDGENWVLEVANAPFSPRTNVLTAVLGDTLFVVGGRETDNSRNKEIWSSQDGVNWVQIAFDTPFPQRSSSDSVLISFNGKLWIIGGTDRSAPDGSYGDALADIWSSSDGITWILEKAAAEFGPRRNHQIYEHAGKLWLVGGKGIPNVSSYALDAYSDIWSSVNGVDWKLELDKTPFGARHSHQIIKFNNQFWLFGGRKSTVWEVNPDFNLDVFNFQYHLIIENDIWVSDDGLHWTEKAATTPLPHETPAVTFNNKMWIGNPGSTVWSSNYGYVPQPPTGLPLIIGNPKQGATVAVDIDDIVDASGINALTYQWFVNDYPVPEEQASTFFLDNLEPGNSITVEVRYINGNEDMQTLTSDPVYITLNPVNIEFRSPVIQAVHTTESVTNELLGYSTDYTVVYSSDNSTVATVISGGAAPSFLLKSPGVANITAFATTLEGHTKTISFVLEVIEADDAISFQDDSASKSLNYFGFVNKFFHGNYGFDDITVSSGNENIASVLFYSDNGVYIAANGIGTTTITARKAGENGSADLTTSFNLEITNDDFDNDTITDAEDNCPSVYNPYQQNSDTDGLGNACDPDDDNDQMPDIFEILFGLDTLSPSDAELDNDNDGFSNLDEFLKRTNPLQPNNPPVNVTDANGDGTSDALSDGLLIIRYLFGLNGSALTHGALSGGTRTNSSEIVEFLNQNAELLDVDGNNSNDALTDGLLIIRYLFGLRGSALITNAVGANATRTSAIEIENFLNNYQ